MVKCTVIETGGFQRGICDLCDHHCERDYEGTGRRFPHEEQLLNCAFYQRAYYLKPLEPNLSRVRRPQVN
ncbi:MAG TPA: hypothetical protein GXX50_12025 [Firmicutes bacterium]|jgi:hypothetical protein|nr:hypothetical protein [Bacillota bacterium]MDK2927585.1 hypothetical protein [Bacillota bacterium]HHV58463.1 hypothetical protein [Bacillota bacterium]